MVIVAVRQYYLLYALLAGAGVKPLYFLNDRRIPPHVYQGINVIHTLPVTKKEIDVGGVNVAVACKIYDFHDYEMPNPASGGIEVPKV